MSKDSGPERKLTKIEKAGKRGGGFTHPTLGRMVKGKRGGTGGGGNSSTPNSRWHQGSFGSPGKIKGKVKQVIHTRTIDGVAIDRHDL